MSKLKLNNLLVQYKGGGYEGCFWEWNYFLFDSKGEFHVIAASGYAGIKTLDEALKLLNKPASKWNVNPEFYTYRLTNKKQVASFQAECAPQNVADVTSKVNDIYGKNVMFWECENCAEKQHDGEMFHAGYRGNGGIGVQAEGMLCMDCYCSGHCRSCDSYDAREQVEVKTEHGYDYVCPDCVPTAVAS